MLEFEKYESALDVELKRIYNLVVARISDVENKTDALVLFEGDEGCGKTNHGLAFAKYCAIRTGRELSDANVRFQADQMINEAKMTKRKIFIWDEPALQGLKKQWWNSTQINLVQLLMMARKNQHLFIFNITDFTEFNKYIIRRAICMVRIYKRKENDKTRRFLYFGRKKLRLMFENFTSSHKRKYTNYATRHGSMPNVYVLPLIISEDAYENAKDVAIQSIGEDLTKKKDKKLLLLQSKIALGFKRMKEAGIEVKLKDFAKIFGVSASIGSRWKETFEKEGISLEELEENTENTNSTINKGLITPNLSLLSPNEPKEDLELANTPYSNLEQPLPSVVPHKYSKVPKQFVGEGIMPEELDGEDEEDDFD